MAVFNLVQILNGYLMSDKVEIAFEVAGTTQKLANIPTHIWKRFCDMAQELYPDMGQDAWSALLADLVLAPSGKTSVLTDIPKEALDKLNAECKVSGTDWTQVHSNILESAVNSTLQIFDLKQGQAAVVLTGIPVPWITALQRQIKRPAAFLFITMLKHAGGGTLGFTAEGIDDNS